MSELKKVSVVTIINKGTRFYVTAIKSFLYQSYANTQWIVIDNSGRNIVASKIAKYLQKDTRISFYNNEKVLTAPEVFKQAIDLCNGSYVAFLDPQDYWIKDKLMRQLSFMMRFAAHLCHTSYAFADDKCHLLPIGCYHVEGNFNILNYSTKNPVSLSTLMLYKDHVKLDFGKYDNEEGTDLMTFLLKNGLVSTGIADVMTLCRPIFDKSTQSKIDELLHRLMVENPDDKTTSMRVIEHLAYNALNVEGIKLDPSVCIGHDVVTSLNRLRNFKI